MRNVVLLVLTALGFATACGDGANGVDAAPTILPPTALGYSTNPAIYTTGQAITENSPSSSGGAVTSYSISALPPGLSLSTTTGVISGTPTMASPMADYTVTAANAGGSTMASLTMTVIDIAPSALTYSTNPATYLKGMSIAANTPSSSGGTVVSYAVSPALPSGLSLDSSTGVISGTPTALTTTASYSTTSSCTVTATNTAGSTTANLSVTVNAALEAYVKASNTAASDYFGAGIALSGDGSTLAIGAFYEDSAATGIGGNQTDNSAVNSGAVYVFTRVGTTWSQQAYIKASNTNANDLFGTRVALSDDGSTLAVGAQGEASAATGVDGNQADNSAFVAGAVYVFTRAGATWSQQAYVKASNTEAGDYFGFQGMALSGDGSTLAVSATAERGGATGVGGNQADNSMPNAGAVYVFTRAGTTWSQQAYVKASNTESGDYFGLGIALSGDGSTMAIGTDSEDSASTGIDGNQSDNSAPSSGAVYVFTRTGTTWSQQAYVKASNTEASDLFGRSVALSDDGSTLAVDASGEDSVATGIGGNQADNSARDSGAVYLFIRAGTTWSQQAYVKASNTETDDQFGTSTALSGDGSTLAVGARRESSAATRIGGNQADDAATDSGAVYVLTRTGATWSQQAYVKASNTDAFDFFGFRIALSGDGSTLAVGTTAEDSAATGIGGNQADNSAQTSGAVYVYR